MTTTMTTIKTTIPVTVPTGENEVQVVSVTIEHSRFLPFETLAGFVSANAYSMERLINYCKNFPELTVNL